MQHLRAIKYSIEDSSTGFVAYWVTVVVGWSLIAINQGIPLILGEPMTLGRWISACITPMVPFLVSCHGQGMKKTGWRFSTRDY